jgi:hypothetical protein
MGVSTSINHYFSLSQRCYEGRASALVSTRHASQSGRHDARARPGDVLAIYQIIAGAHTSINTNSLVRELSLVLYRYRNASVSDSRIFERD